MLPEAVFFDWDGTLVDSLDFVFAAHNHVREKMGFAPWTRPEFVENAKYSSRQLYPKIYPGREQEAYDILADYMEQNHLKQIVLIDGAAELLDALQAAGVPMGVVSNKRDAFLKKEVTHLGWDKYFRIAVGAGYAANDKPEADPLLKALGEAGLQVSDKVLYTGDTESDLLCARNAGVRVAFLYHSNPSNPLIAKYNPEITAVNCVDLKAALFAPCKP